MSEWNVDPRKHLTKEIIKVTEDWSETLLVQLPVSLLVHLFTRFRSKIVALFKGDFRTRNIKEQALLFTPVIIFHYNLWAIFSFLQYVDVRLMKMQLNRILKRHYPNKEVVLWLYYPRLLPLADAIKHRFLVYDFQDNYDYSQDGTELKLDSELNEKLIKKSDFVICTAKALYQRAIQLNVNSALVQNGNNFEVFSANNEENHNGKLAALPKPIIGYIGGIKKLLDFDLLNYIIDNFKEVNFVFIGLIYKPAKEVFKLQMKKPNVLWVGFKEPAELAAYVRKFDVAILPFVINKFTEGVYPNKFLEYMAAEVPVVTTALPDLEEFSDKIGYSRTKEEFLENCRKALNGDFESKLREYSSIAKENSWHEKAKIINANILARLEAGNK